MRIVAWNIRAGGGTRLERIYAALAQWNPDTVALSEYRATPPSVALAHWLADQGLHYQASTASAREPAKNALLIASRFPLQRVRPPRVIDTPRVLAVRMPVRTIPTLIAPAEHEFLRLTAVHVPNRATGRKYDFLDALVRHAKRISSKGPSIIVGDTNSGCREVDEESSAFNKREERWFDELAAAGVHDAFRHRHDQRRAFTWYSPNGRNGFRLDQLLCSPSVLERVKRIEYEWGEAQWNAGVSDHAAIVTDLAG
jgi:exonuclease III